MGNVMSLILEQRITPAVNNTFWSIIGNWFVSVGAILRDSLFNLLYILCKFALNVVDFMQLLVQKLAGVDAWLHLERLDLENLQETDIVFRFLLSDTVQTVFRSMIAIFLVLLIVFSIVAIIKNEYGAATTGKAVDHKQTWYSAFKAIITVVLVPVLLIGGILTSNAILAGLMKAFSINSSLSLGGQIFMASAYDASDYRRYASNGTRMPVSNMIQYTDSQGETYFVDTQISVTNPRYYTDSTPFRGYMFTFNAKDYFLWECDKSFEENGKHKDYNYLKFILGAYIVEASPSRSESSNYSYYKEHYNSMLTDDPTIVNKVAQLYLDRRDSYGMSADGWINGYVLNDLSEGAGTILTAARNTWGYNQDLTSGISGWTENNDTLEIIANQSFSIATGGMRTANVIKNSHNWGSLHDGGVDGYHPLAVEYEVMADIMDFAIGNNVKLYFVNSNNSMINYYFGNREATQFDRSTIYVKDGKEAGYLVEYKKYGRVAYPFSPESAQSEVEGATYVVCYYDAQSGSYVPLTNGVKMYDEHGDSYTFRSGKFADSYHGVVIARGLFKKTSTWVGYMPTYIAQTMIIQSGGVSDFNDTDLVSANAQNTGYYYNFLEKLTNQDGTDYFKSDVASGNAIYKDGKYTYYSDVEMTRENLATAMYHKFAEFKLYDGDSVFADIDYGNGSFTEEDDPFDIVLSHGDITAENFQKYVLRFKYTGKQAVLVDTDSTLIAYEFDLATPSAIGYTSDLRFADSTKRSVVGYGDYAVSYDHEAERQFTFYSTKSAILLDTEVRDYVMKVAVPQVIGNTAYTVLNIESNSSDGGIKGTMTLTLVETASVGDSGARKWTVVLTKDSESIPQDGVYSHLFSVEVSGSLVELELLGEFNNATVMEYNSSTIGSSSYTEGEVPHNVRYFNSELHYFSDDSHFDTTIHARNTTLKLGNYVATLYKQAGYTAVLLPATVGLTRAEISGYGAYFILKVSKETEIFYIKITLEMTDRIDTGKTIDDETGEDAKEVYERVISFVYDVQNTYKLHSTATLGEERSAFDDEMYSQIASLDPIVLNDLEYVGSDIYDGVPGGSIKARQYKYVDSRDQKHTKTFILNAYQTGKEHVDGGLVFAGYYYDGGKYVLTQIKDTYDYHSTCRLFYKLSEVKITRVADYIASYKASGKTTYFVLDLQNVGETSVFMYQFDITDGRHMNDDNEDNSLDDVEITIEKYIYTGTSYQKDADFEASDDDKANAREYVRAHVNITYEYLPTKKFSDYNTSGSTGLQTLYSVNLTSISGINYSFYATNVDQGHTPEDCADLFFRYLTTVSDGVITYNTSNTAESVSTTEQMLARFAKNPLTVIFCRDDMEERWINLDFRLHLYWSGLIPHFIFRFYIGSQIVKSNANTSTATVARGSDSTQVVQILNHKQVISLRSGMLAIDYNFLGNVAVDNLYILYAINWLVLVIAIVIVFSILGKAVWGLIKRIYQITLLFLIMPAVASTIPLDDSKRFGDWRKSVIEEVLGAYGVCLGLNFFFIIMPVIRDASAIFTDADISTKTLGMLGYIVNADMLNLLCYILFLLVALTLLKTVPALVSKIVGGKDAIAEGAQTKKDMLNTVTEAGNMVSGKAAMDAVKQAGDVMLGEKGKDGKRHGGLIPGAELGRAAKGTVDGWRAKNAARKAERDKQTEEFNKNAAHDNVANNLDDILSKGKDIAADQAPAEASDMTVNEGDTSINPSIAIEKGASKPTGTTSGTDAGAGEESSNDASALSNVESVVSDAVAEAGKEYTLADNDSDKNSEYKVPENMGDFVSTVNSDENLTSFAGEADSAKTADKAGEAVDTEARAQIQQLAGALKEVNDATVGKYHDYKGDQEKAEADARQEAKETSRSERAAAKEEAANARATAREDRLADRQEAKAARVEAKNEAVGAQIQHYKDEAASGKLKGRLSKSDIARWNKEHADKKIASRDEFSRMTADEKEAQRQIRREARQEAYMHDNLLKARDLENGIKHGALASTVRKLVGGEKTAAQKEKEQEALENAKAGLANSEKGVRKEMHDNIVADLMKKPEFARKNKKQLDMIADARIKSNYDNASDEDKKKFMKKWASDGTMKDYNKALKAVKNAEKTTKEEKKGALYKAGKGVAFVGGKVGQGASWLGSKFADGASWLGGKAKQGLKVAGGAVAKAALATKDFTVKVGKAVANSAPVQAAVKAGKAVGRGVATAGKAVGGAVATAGKAVGKAAATAGKAVGKAAATAGKAVGKAGKAVGGAVATAGKAVGKAAATAGKAVAGVANKAVGKVQDAASFVSSKATKAIHAASDKIKGTVWYQYLKDSAKNVKNILNKRKNDKAFVASHKTTDADVENMSKKVEKKLAGRKNVTKEKSDAKREARATKAAKKSGELRKEASQHRVIADKSRADQRAIDETLRRALNGVYKDLGQSARTRIDRDFARERARLGRGRLGPNVLSRVVKRELERQLRELNKQAGNGVSAQLNAELSRVKSQLARLTAANSSYSKRIKTLTESNKKLSRSVKSGKSASALEQQINHKNSFTGN